MGPLDEGLKPSQRHQRYPLQVRCQPSNPYKIDAAAEVTAAELARL